MLKKIIWGLLLVLFVRDYCSLKAQEQAVSEDTITIEQLQKQYLENRQINPMLATEYAAQALQLATELKDSVQMAVSLNYLGDCYFNRKAYSMALDYYFKAYRIFQHFKEQKHIAFSLIDIGNIYFEQNLSSIAKNYYEQAQEIFDKIGDKEGLALVYDRIGFVNLRHGNEDEALKYFINAHYFRKSLKDPELLALSNQNIAEVYLEREEYGKAIEFLNNALENFKDDKYLLNVADINTKIGDIYVYDENYVKAIESYNHALDIYKKYQHNYEISLLHNRLAATYLDLNKLISAKKQCLNALNIAYMYDFLDIKAKSYRLMSDIYERQKNIKKAFDFQKRYAAVVDSIMEAKQINQSAEMQVSYEIQQQENEIAMLTKDGELNRATIEKQRAIAIAIGIGSVLLMIFAFSLYRSNVHKQKINKILTEQKKDIEDKNAELYQQQQAIVEQNKKIQKINKNITGSINYASRIQKAMLPKPDIFNEFFKDAFVFFKPREQVSGDFYWISKNEEEEKVIVAVVDCTGHGVPGAFMSLIGNSYLNQIVNHQRITAPDMILNLLHINIRISLNQDKNESRDGMDLALCVFDYKNNTIEFAGARHPIFYIVNNELIQVKGDSMDIGGVQRESERRFTKQIIPIQKDMVLYMFSDGFQDQFGGPKREKFMRKRFKDFLMEIHHLPMNEQRYRLEQKFDEWRNCGDGTDRLCDQIDDVLIVGLKL
ncbi:MAG: tetratricopeptide repeat protein [Bacteroidales bacterium]|nr:tetratricopeptide repeat protein [Bacteroidales bacterium]